MISTNSVHHRNFTARQLSSHGMVSKRFCDLHHHFPRRKWNRQLREIPTASLQSAFSSNRSTVCNRNIRRTSMTFTSIALKASYTGVRETAFTVGQHTGRPPSQFLRPDMQRRIASSAPDRIIHQTKNRFEQFFGHRNDDIDPHHHSPSCALGQVHECCHRRSPKTSLLLSAQLQATSWREYVRDVFDSATSFIQRSIFI
jgi:hypothetical protein